MWQHSTHCLAQALWLSSFLGVSPGRSVFTKEGLGAWVKKACCSYTSGRRLWSFCSSAGNTLWWERSKRETALIEKMEMILMSVLDLPELRVKWVYIRYNTFWHVNTIEMLLRFLKWMPWTIIWAFCFFQHLILNSWSLLFKAALPKLCSLRYLGSIKCWKCSRNQNIHYSSKLEKHSIV